MFQGVSSQKEMAQVQCCPSIAHTDGVDAVKYPAIAKARHLLPSNT
jgi:hypothetical protein